MRAFVEFGKFMKRKFYTCYNCEFKIDCKVAESRLEGVSLNSPIVDDIGCFEHEIYKAQTQSKQLGLF